jgi:hypothetical protein
MDALFCRHLKNALKHTRPLYRYPTFHLRRLDLLDFDAEGRLRNGEVASSPENSIDQLFTA